MRQRDLINQITAYLSNGGFFNPELANHDAVRDLLIECRETLAQPERTWVCLTDEERKDLCRSWPSPMDAIYATESKLKDKNK